MSAIQRRAVVFADLRGSTALYELIGNADASAVVTETVDSIARRVPATGGVLVKTLGDGLMAVFPTAAQAVEAADQMHEELDVVMAPDQAGTAVDPAAPATVGGPIPREGLAARQCGVEVQPVR